jgi:hypothetical protein
LCHGIVDLLTRRRDCTFMAAWQVKHHRQKEVDGAAAAAREEALGVGEDTRQRRLQELADVARKKREAAAAAATALSRRHLAHDDDVRRNAQPVQGHQQFPRPVNSKSAREGTGRRDSNGGGGGGDAAAGHAEVAGHGGRAGETQWELSPLGTTVAEQYATDVVADAERIEAARRRAEARAAQVRRRQVASLSGYYHGSWW